MGRDPAQAEPAVVAARGRLGDARAALARVTGGAPPAVVLAELAQQLAAELAPHWDELPGHRFTGRVARVPGVLGTVLPGRRVPHRVVLARYLSSTAPKRAGGGYLVRITTVAVLGLGTDGVLRAGRLMEAIRLGEGTELPSTPLRWDDDRVRRVPSRTVWVSRWRGGGDPHDVARPAEVLDALAALASHVAEASRRVLELLQRLLGTGG
ncbi:MAG TPA: hypothetical protein VFJ82_15800 [Longimicrobium sp.]|nr:hypothetical protein [Longimicrobium sp.]